MNQRQSSTKSPTKIKINGIEINYLKTGNGPKVLLLMPGTLGNIAHFNSIIPLFDKEKYTIVVWEPPGYGLSRPPDRDFTLGHLHRDKDHAITLMETLQFDKYSLLGWCSGGTTALILASEAVDRVENLVVWSCNSYFTDEDLVFIRKSEWPENIKQKHYEYYGERYSVDTWSAFIESIQMTVKNNGGNICREALPKIKAPTLIMHGAQDGLVPIHHASYLNMNIKHSKLEIYPDGRHALHIKLPQQFCARVDKFLTIGQ